MSIIYMLKHGHNAAILANENIDNLIISDETLKSLQSVIKEIYRDMKETCDKYGITLFLTGGSALGCVRHKGFIPWDDDLDVAMSRDDYNRFKAVFEKELGGKYILNAPDCSDDPIERFPKVLKKGTRFVSPGEDYRENISCIFIDIFIIDSIPNSPLCRGFQGSLVNICEFAGGQVLFWNNWDYNRLAYKVMGRAYLYIRAILGAMFSIIPYRRWMKIIDRLIANIKDNTKDCGTVTGRNHYFGEILPRDFYYPAKKMQFEGIESYVYNNVEGYLSHLYGDDYLTLPPIEKREHHYVKELLL